MQEVSSASAIDAVLLVGHALLAGLHEVIGQPRRAAGARDSLILSPAAFGHAGMGGSLGFADPAARLSFGYTMNKQGRGVLLNERGQALVDAVYRSLGYRTCAAGMLDLNLEENHDMKCWFCDNDARGTCAACGRGLCHRPRPLPR